MHKPGKLLSFTRRDAVIVHDVKRIAGLPHVQPRKRAPRTANRIESTVFAIVQHVEIFEGFLHEFLCLLERLAGDVLERKATERQRYAAAHARAVHVDEFERTAAEVSYNAVRLVDSGHDPKCSEMGLALSRQDCDCRAANAFGFSDERAAVARVAACRRGDSPNAPDMQDIAEGAEPNQCVERRIDSIRRQQAGRLNLAPKPGQDFLVEDRRWRTSQPFVDDKTDRIGTDIDNSNWRAVVEAALCRRDNCGRTLTPPR